MNHSSAIRHIALAGLLSAAATIFHSSPAEAALNSCVTRTISGTYSGTTWMQQTVCAVGEIAVSAGGFCSAAGDMKGVSTTSGTSDRLVWLWCNQSGAAIWYAMCCKP
jgi:hypothetical protein